MITPLKKNLIVYKQPETIIHQILKNKKTRNMNISEIAYEVGFNDPKYFTRCFTKHFKVAPSNLMGKE